MKKYVVQIEFTSQVEYTVEAEDEESAEEQAVELWMDGMEGDASADCPELLRADVTELVPSEPAE
jgi:hypothetical protein